ncbi:eukaryotic translation initiation factor 3 subunit J-A isoform X1 [Carassius auratus]|uniref:Eukaryotic translation initiation factor 3 subunit J n=1 Tax=Carassius auratus TaxID=7957 RepID=A0A6P6JGB4_CARAU|nr:eukaryotic translation initiation factor 3 subunit J-A isoform X1 [Carassius auratus]XP_052454372.1 eukaryotic translation initiation factor 3 subunit J-A isoform X1 [Carassius gibelio]
MADADDWDADSFDPEEPIKKAAVHDKWEGEDEDDDVKDNWDDDEEEEKEEEKKSEAKPTEKKKLSEKIKEKENLQRKKQEELLKQLEESEDSTELTPEEELAEKLRVKKLQEDSDLELAKEAFGKCFCSSMSTFVLIIGPDHSLILLFVGVVSNNVTGIDAMSPSTKEDFTEFERLLKEKISSYEKSIHYSSFLETLFRDLCLSLEVEDFKKISTSLTVLLSEKQRQEKANKGKKKKKGVLPGGGLKATKRDDLADYGEFDGGYAQDYEDFM